MKLCSDKKPLYKFCYQKMSMVSEKNFLVFPKVPKWFLPSLQNNYKLNKNYAHER